ncbi:MAG TPA: FliH/SctL family protein [Sphingomonadaceae bacterium]|nr:FliH/SctL family protein [Sphingomonadaceae bacterium]
MSDLWNRASAVAAARISPFIRSPEEQVFTPWSAAARLCDVATASDEEDTAEPEVHDVLAQAYSDGFNEGRRVAEKEYAAERDAVARLAETLQALEPEPSGALAALLAETVERLVRQIVGEVAIDGEILLERAANAAALIAEEASPARMRLHPDDLARLDGADLPVEKVADPALAPGTVLLETGEGWIEDGPAAGLEKLRIALDRMGAPR